jgi:hypothetical protein
MNVYPTNSDYKEMTFTTFEEQRKSRLSDSLDEYLNEGDCDVDVFYKDLRNCLIELRDYHIERGKKAQEALDAVLGHRPIPELDQDPEFPQGNRL